MRRASDAARSHVDRAWIGFGIGDKVQESFDRERCRDHDNERSFADARYRHDIAHEIEAQIRVERRVDRIGRDRHQDCVSVCRGIDDVFGADIAAKAGLVFDDELLA